jgi:hypothetical protein
VVGAGEAAPGERLEGAKTGAEIGAATGPVAAALGTVGSRLWAGLRGAVTPGTQAAADLARALGRDEISAAALAERTAEAQATRPGAATLADVGGTNVRGLVERVAQTPGAGREIVVPALTERQINQRGRVASDLTQLAGTEKSAIQAIDDTLAERATNARPLYERAMSVDVQTPLEPLWKEITERGWGRRIVAAMRRNLETEFGTADPAAVPMMTRVDLFKRQADDFAKSAERAGRNNEARIIGAMRDRLVAAADRANPLYAEARNAWAGPSRYLDAIDQGRKITSRKLSAEALEADLAGMSDSEREGYRIGAVSALLGQIGSDPAKLSDTTKFLRSPQMRAKIRAMMPTSEAADAFERRLDFEIRSSELVGQSLGGSQTARRLAERDDAQALVGDLVLHAFTGAPPMGLFKRLMVGGWGMVRDTTQSRRDRALAELLLDPTMGEREKRAIERALQYREPTAEQSAFVGGLAAPGIEQRIEAAR